MPPRPRAHGGAPTARLGRPGPAAAAAGPSQPSVPDGGALRGQPDQQQQQQQQQAQTPAQTPAPAGSQAGRATEHAAAAQAAAEGEEEEPLWWVEKFEARRQQLQHQQASTSSSSGSTSAAGSSPSHQQQQQQRRLPPAAPVPVPWRQLALQLVQLAAVLSGLILWPASLYPGGLASGRVWWAFCVYIVFFGGGSVWRLVRYGPLASRERDRQARTAGTRAAWAAFMCLMPLLHWGALGSFLKRRATAALQLPPQPGSGGGVSLYEVLGMALLLAAVALNLAAARQLGKAYDRVVRPEALVVSGPYALVQHPIYASYMLLFCGYAMWMHGHGYAALALAVCLWYYRGRAALEAEVLREAFGDAYDAYRARTKLFVPYMM